MHLMAGKAYQWRCWDMSVMFSGGIRDKVKMHRSETHQLSSKKDVPASTSEGKEGEEGEESTSEEGNKQKTGKTGDWGTSWVQPLLECHYSLNGAFLEDPLSSCIDRYVAIQ